MDEPTAGQQRLLNAIWASFRRERQWPRYVGIDQLLDREGLNARELIPSMPTGLMIPDVQRSGFLYHPQANDELRVTVLGLRYCEDTEPELHLLARLVRYIADREQTFVLPSLSEPTQLVVTSEEARRDLSLTDEGVARAWGLLTSFETRLWGGGGSPRDWSLTIDIGEARRYRGVESPDDYLAARAELDRPRERSPLPRLPSDQAPELAAISASDIELPVAAAQAASKRRGLRVLGPVLSHPIVAAVIAGLILLAIGVVLGR